MKSFIVAIMQISARLVVPPCFWLSRWYMHNRMKFFHRESPNVMSLPLVIIGEGQKIFRAAFIREFAEYALPKYKSFTEDHYSAGGYGYGGLEKLDSGAARARYASGKSRLTHYLDHNTRLLDCVDGDSFLDAGCGDGFNIRELARRFPSSVIHGFDVNDAALSIVRIAEAHPKLTLRQGTFLDPKFMATLLDLSFDWVLISHALAFVTGLSISDTWEVRTRLVQDLVRVSRKGVIILDGPPDTGFSVEIEHDTRCAVKSNYMMLFTDLRNGELYAMQSKVDWAYCWRKFPE